MPQNPNHIETEIKLYVSDFAPVVEQLRIRRARLITPSVFECNVRFENKEQSLTPSGIVLRLRQDRHVVLTYKGPLRQANNAVMEGIKSRYEVEVEVSDFDDMHLILNLLGYHEHIRYEKYRTTYRYNNTEVVLDQMPFGKFVEIEGQADDIEDVVTELGLCDAPRFGESYIELFDRLRHNLKLEVDHLTFENFAGVTVSLEALQSSTSAS
ncbi:MAG: class IV adenylate cyclase [Phototrophicales bacterium]|nr:MAG: class IV adenylate cyclase [Phototrophicales bacterium]